ncbi:MAG: NFACT family protein [Candidatus Aenigmarchaeota archaeon]|nr:NFACT family protein [Candidatus Aenigmarchaeota archaeon]
MQNTRKLTSFDLKILAEELDVKLKGARVQKVFSFNPTEKKEDSEMHLLIHIPTHGTHRLVIGIDRIFLTKEPILHDESSGNFALYLRKHLKSKRITGIRQHNFDRVLIIEFEDNILVCEVFAKSNLIFLDKESKILALKTRKIWSGRALKRGEEYLFPPATENIFSIDDEGFINLMKKSDKRIVSYLSSGLSLGKEYANAVCEMAKINKTDVCSALDEKQVNLLFEQIKGLISVEKKPFVLEDEDKRMIDYYPLDVPTKGKRQFKESFSDAVGQYYMQYYKILREQKEGKEEQGIIEKSERILENQAKNRRKIEDKVEKVDKTIEKIKENYGELIGILLDINNALLKIEIREVKDKILSAKKTAVDENIKIIENIDEKTKEILFDVDGIKFRFSINKTFEQNLAAYYDESKKAKAKLVRLETVQKQQEWVKEKQVETHQKTVKKIKLAEIKKEWYHKFHWFFTSGNILVIGGKTAQQNEEVIKKYAKDKDLVFHCDIAGSPFVVLKTSQVKNEATKEDLYEAAVFSAVYSRAWRVGIGAIESYWVEREQVTKKAPSGEFIGTGSFMIYGKKNIIKTVLEYAVGFVDGRLIFGPAGVIEKMTSKCVVVVPGDVLKNKLAKEIKEVLAEKLNREEKEILRQVNVNYIENSLPGLKGDIKR